MRIRELAYKAHENAYQKGFWDDYENIINKMSKSNNFKAEDIETVKQAFMTQKMMLIVTELAEGTEALRAGDIENYREELADVMIRLGDFAGGHKIDIETEIQDKMKTNRDRPEKHGKSF